MRNIKVTNDFKNKKTIHKNDKLFINIKKNKITLFMININF